MDSLFKVVAVQLTTYDDGKTFYMWPVVQNLSSEPARLHLLSMRRSDKDDTVRRVAAHFPNRVVKPGDKARAMALFDENADHFHFLEVHYVPDAFERKTAEEVASLNQTFWIKRPLRWTSKIGSSSLSFDVELEPPPFPYKGWLAARRAQNYFELTSH